MSWGGLDWGQAHACDMRYWRALEEALLERGYYTHGRPIAHYTSRHYNYLRPVAHQLPRDIYNAALVMASRFWRWDDDVNDYVQCTDSYILSRPDCDIGIMPGPATIIHGGWGDWMRKVKNVIGYYHIKEDSSLIKIERCLSASSPNNPDDEWRWWPTVGSAINAALENPVNAGDTSGASWDFVRYHEGTASSFSASTHQATKIKVINPTRHAFIPTIRTTSWGDASYTIASDGAYNYTPAPYDPLGTGWVEGYNTLESVSADSSNVILDLPMLQRPEHVVTPPPSPNPWSYVESKHKRGYILSPSIFVDYKTQGGYTYQ